MRFRPSPQQQAVFNFITDRQGSAFVEAVAGAGKTTTLVHACSLMQGDIAFCAYNKKIATEIQGRTSHLPNVNACTFHSAGFRAWRQVADRSCKVDQFGKWDRLLDLVGLEYHSFVKKAVSLAKQRALGVFGSIRDLSQWYAIVDHFNLAAELEETASIEQAILHCIAVLENSNAIGKKLIDFDDMIYLPLLKNIRLDQYDWVLVDEAQDTNPARRALARKMLKPGGRAIFVGDRHQAIYGFTGADNNAVNLIIQEFNCQSLPLTTTYRCPKAVVTAAQEFVSHIQAHENAPEGSVEHYEWGRFAEAIKTGEVKQTDAVLCRNTRPLVTLAYYLLRKNVPCHVEGRDIGQGLLALITKWKLWEVDLFLEKLEMWEIAQIERMKARNNELGAESIRDKAETLRVLCEGCDTMNEVKQRIETLFKDTDEGRTAHTLTLSTVHKAKGREWPTVYVLDYYKRMPSKAARLPWEREQELNLIYVAFTRAQERLVTIE